MKVRNIFLSLACLSLFYALPFSGFAQTSSVDASALIQNLENRITALQTQMIGLQNDVAQLKSALGLSGAAPAPIPQRGETSDEVKRVQEFLTKFPDVYPRGLVTGYFGDLTSQALSRFQTKYGIPQTGLIDTSTRAKILELQAPVLTAPAPSLPLPAATATPITPTTTSAPAATSTYGIAPRFSFSFPLRGDQFTANVTSTIQWGSSEQQNTIPKIHMSVYSNGIFKEFIATDTPNTGSFQWAPPERLAGGTYTIRIFSILYPTHSNESVPFQIASSSSASAPTSATTPTTPSSPSSSSSSTAPYASSTGTGTSTYPIAVTAPNGGEEWLQGNAYAITWTPTDLSYVTIELVDNLGSAAWLGYVPDNGSWTWTIPINQTYKTGASYMIKILNPNNHGNYDMSNAYFTIAPPATTAPTDTATSLIGHWKFDGNGTNEVAGSPAALPMGTVNFYQSGGKLGGYANISGSADYVRIPYDSRFDLANSFTVEFWFRQRSNQSFAQNLVSKGTGPNNYNFYIFRQLWNENNFGPVITGYTASNTGYWTQTSNSNQLTHNAWHHVVFVKSPTFRAYYLDGQETHSATDSPSARTPASDIHIGKPAIDTDIDNLKIYNRALTLGEVLYGYNGGTGIASERSTQNFQAQFADITTSFSRIVQELQKLLGR